MDVLRKQLKPHKMVNTTDFTTSANKHVKISTNTDNHIIAVTDGYLTG